MPSNPYPYHSFGWYAWERIATQHPEVLKQCDAGHAAGLEVIIDQSGRANGIDSRQQPPDGRRFDFRAATTRYQPVSA